jgi:hypothetical protein
MPITRRQFELGIDAKTEEWMDRIRTFLAEHRDEAFTDDELWKAIYAKPTWTASEREAFDEALYTFVYEAAEESVGRKKIRDIYYYAYEE